jgi:K+-transporting ATPase KdpF subunit
MKTFFLICLIVPLSTVAGNDVRMSNPSGYYLGAVLAVFLLAYLVYSLIKPEKF